MHVGIAMPEPTTRTPELEPVDEAVAESFPASDAPGWTTAHLGAPVPHGVAPEHAHELRAELRSDLERFARAPAEREDAVVETMLDVTRSVLREPVDSARAHNVECELRGADLDAPCVILSARQDQRDSSGLAALLAVLRSLAPARMRRTVRFAALASAGALPAYVGQLRSAHASVEAMVTVSRLDLTRSRTRARVLFVGSLRWAAAVRAARDAFRGASRIPSRALWLPAWLLRGGPAAPSARGDERWPIVTVTDGSPWWREAMVPMEPDVDRIAAAVPGLAAAVVRLAGGRT